MLTIQIEEIQDQYNECFAEAAVQENLMELQRDAIDNLQQKVQCMNYDNYFTVYTVHTLYYSVLTMIQGQFETCINDFQTVKCKIDALTESKHRLEVEYATAQNLCEKKDSELQELKAILTGIEKREKMNTTRSCQCRMDFVDKESMTEDTIINYNSVNTENSKDVGNTLFAKTILINDTPNKEDDHLKKQLEIHELYFEKLGNEIQRRRKNKKERKLGQLIRELEKMQDFKCSISIKSVEIQKSLNEEPDVFEELLSELRFNNEEEIIIEKYLIELKTAREEVKHQQAQINSNKSVIEGQNHIIEQLQTKLCTNEQYIQQCTSELNASKEMISILRDRVHSLKTLLKEKCDNMAKLQADYEVLKNNNSILITEHTMLENRAKEEVCLLKNKLKDAHMELSVMNENYKRTSEDFNKTQEQLVTAVKREVDLQESLTAAEKELCCKVANSQKEIDRLNDIIERLNEKLQDMQKELSHKDSEFCQLQTICRSYAEQLELTKRDLYELGKKYAKVDESNCRLIQQLHRYMDENCSLLQEKSAFEESNCKYMNELENTHKSLQELRKECQSKIKSLACLSTELSQTAVSRSELCNESQYMISCIRIWMDEQNRLTENLSAKLQAKQQQLIYAACERKALMITIRELKRVNNILAQRLKRTHRPTVCTKSVSTGCYVLPCSTPQNVYKSNVGPIRTSRRTSVSGNSWFFPKMEHLTNELRKSNHWWITKAAGNTKTENIIDESRDCGYQSSASK